MKILLILFLLWFLQSCSSPGETLVWSDESEGSGLTDPTKWSYGRGNSGFGNNEVREYTNLSRINSIVWTACGEIDVMEYVGRNPGSFHSSVHTSSNFGTT